MSLRFSRPIALVVCAVMIACGSEEPSPPTVDQRLDALRACPAGDKPWSDALGAVLREGRSDELLTLALALSESHPEAWEPAWMAGECLIRTNPPEAKPHFETALDRARTAADPVGVACAANRLGQFGYLAGELGAGEEYYREAIEAAGQAGRADLDAFTRNNLAGLLVERGEYIDARQQLEQAAKTFAELGLPHAVRAAEFNRGVVLLELGDAVGARETLQEVHALASAAGDDATLRETAVTLGNLELALDDPARAANWYALGVGGDPDVEALAHLGLGRVELAAERYAEASELLERAATQAREQERLFALIAEALWADAEARSGDVAAARERLDRVIEQSDAQDAEESAWAARWILGKLLSSEQAWSEAIPVLEQAIEILERQQAPLDPLGDGLYFLRERADPYVDLAFAITSSGAMDSASRVAEIAGRAQTRTLRRLVFEDAAEGAEPRADLAAIRSALRPGELLLDYLIGDARGVLLAVTHDDARVTVLAGRRELDATLRAFTDSLRQPNADDGSSSGGVDLVAGRALSRALLDPVSQLVQQADRVYVVPDRELAQIPFAALPWADGVLLDSHEIATMPLAGPPPRWSGKPRAPVLLAGQPTEAGPEFPELPWAAYELSGLRDVWGEQRSTLVHGEAFNREHLVDLLKTTAYPTLHLATHAVASTHDPRLCGVVLSGGERLGLDDVARGSIELPADSLVVLSACRTGVGEVVPGEGVIGLGWSFLQAGARAVVVTHWTVDDVAAAKLMIAFHRGLADGTEPVTALTTAARELRREDPRYEHPAYWAPFVIQLRP